MWEVSQSVRTGRKGTRKRAKRLSKPYEPAKSSSKQRWLSHTWPTQDTKTPVADSRGINDASALSYVHRIERIEKSPLRKKRTNATPPPNDSKKRSVVSRLPLSNHHQKYVKVASKAIIIGQVPTCMCML